MRFSIYRRGVLVLLAVVALVSNLSAQNTTNITLLHLLAGGQPVGYGTVCAQAANTYGETISISAPNWGLLLKDQPMCANVVNGAIAGGLNVPDAQHTDAGYTITYDISIQIKNAAGIAVGPPILLNAVPNVYGATFALDNFAYPITGTAPSPEILSQVGIPATCTAPSLLLEQGGPGAYMCHNGAYISLLIGTVVATGPPGPAGAAATVGIGTVTTLPTGSSASVANTGTTSNAVLAFGIPAGAAGAAGPSGPAGPAGLTIASGPYGSVQFNANGVPYGDPRFMFDPIAGVLSTPAVTGTATNAGVNSTSSNAGRYAFQDTCLWNDQPLGIYGGTDHTCRTISNTYSSPGYYTTGYWSTSKSLQFLSTITGRSISQAMSMVNKYYTVGDNASIYIYHHARSGVIAGSDEGTEPVIVESIEDGPPSGTIAVGGTKATTITPSFTVNARTKGDGMSLVSTSEIMASGLLLFETQVPGETPFTITTSDTHAVSTAVGALVSSCGTLTPRNAGASVTCSVALTTGSFTTASQMCIGDAYPEQVAVTGVGTPSSTQNFTANLTYVHPAGTPVYQGGMCGARLALGYGYANPSTANGGYMTTYEVVGSRTATSLDAIAVFKGGQNGPQPIVIPSQPPIVMSGLTRTSNQVVGFPPTNTGWWNNFVAPPLASMQIAGASDPTLNGIITGTQSIVSSSYPPLSLTWPQVGANTSTSSTVTLSLVGYNNYVAYCGAETVAVGSSTLQVDPNNCAWPVGSTIVQPNHYAQEDTVLGISGSGTTKTADPGQGLGIQLNGNKYAGGSYIGLYSTIPLASYLGYGGVNLPQNVITTNPQNTPVLGYWFSLPAPVNYGCVLCIGRVPEDGIHNPTTLRYNIVSAANRDNSGAGTIYYDSIGKFFNISNLTGNFTAGVIGGTGNGVNFNSISPDMTGQALLWSITGDIVQLRRNVANTGMEWFRNTGSMFTVLDGAVNQAIGPQGYVGAMDPTTVAVTQPAATTGRGLATLDYVHANQAVGSVTTSAATSDVVTVTNATTTSHCGLAATNASAATNIATTYISAKAANAITLTHAGIAGMTYDLVCTAN